MSTGTSKERFEQYHSIDRERFTSLVFNKTKNIDYIHIEAIVNILLEEIMVDIKNGKEIIIENFGSLMTTYEPGAERPNIHTKTREMTSPTRSIRFFLDKKFRQLLLDNVDIDKTLKSGNNEQDGK